MFVAATSIQSLANYFMKMVCVADRGRRLMLVLWLNLAVMGIVSEAKSTDESRSRSSSEVAAELNSELSSDRAVIAHCRKNFNISCACMKHVHSKVTDFSCLDLSKNRCNSDSCQVCTRGGLINTCSFTDFFNGCYTDCKCACRSGSGSRRKAHHSLLVLIKCRDWCKRKQYCPSGQYEDDPRCHEQQHKSIFGGFLNIIWVTLCAIMLYHLLRRRNNLSTWMRTVRDDNTSQELLRSRRTRLYRSPDYSAAPMDNESTSDSSLIEHASAADEVELPPSYEDVLRDHQNACDARFASVPGPDATNTIASTPREAPPPYRPLSKDCTAVAGSATSPPPP